MEPFGFRHHIHLLQPQLVIGSRTRHFGSAWTQRCWQVHIHAHVGVYHQANLLRFSLERALHLAEPEGYIRLFADLGLPMAWLLQEARSRAVLPEYVEALLAAFNLNIGCPREENLSEPLTPREEQVLQLVAAGLTNQEIAEELVISPETVKKHTSHIYGKLSVNNRTEATAKARGLDLLE